MKIGIVGSLWLRTPPIGYGGTEEVIYNVVNGLVDNGHEVSIFGPATTQSKAHLIPTIDQPLREKDIAWSEMNYHLYHYTQAFDRAEEFDILHVHLNRYQDYLSFPLALHSKTPVLFTLHFSPQRYVTMTDRRQILDKYKEFPFTSISHAQQIDMPLNYIATIYNSIALENFPFSDTADDYYAWLGNIKPEKGTKQAIEAAIKANVKLVVMGMVGDSRMQGYFDSEIEPLLTHKNITYVGPVTLEQKVAYLQKAKALLNPVQWDEPFGLVMIESQAVGTPVIATNRGAAAEVIKDGETGFLINTVDEMVQRIHDVEKLQRSSARAFVENKFTTTEMVKGYEKAYEVTKINWEQYIKNQKLLLQKSKE
jgi:glycosyltransferase involved in cell wall biosynthesis